MECNIFAVVILLAVSAVFAEEPPQSINKYFAGWISQLEFDSTNDCYIAQYASSACQHAYVHTSKSKEYRKIQPGERYVVTRGERVLFTQHVGGVGWVLTFTNGVAELNGVSLPVEFKDSSRQLLIEGNRAVRYQVFEDYAFVVNADGEAYDVSARTKFHFGLPFHAPEVKTAPKLNRSIENIQRLFCKEAVEFYKAALDNPTAQAMKGVVKEGATNAVVATVQVGGAYTISEGARNRLLELDLKSAQQMLRRVEESKGQYVCVLFCARETRDARIVAVARVGDGLKCRMWWYEGVSGNPSLIYSRDCQKSTGGYYEYGDAGDLRNLCLFKDGVNTSYHTIKDGVLQKSSDMEKAQAFISKVEEMFARYVELDTTGTLKAFVEKRGSKPVPGR